MTIDPTTSPLTEYVEQRANYPAPSFPAVEVSVHLTDCPSGDYSLGLELRQGGRTAH